MAKNAIFRGFQSAWRDVKFLNLDSCSERKMPSESHEAIWFAKPMQGCVIREAIGEIQLHTIDNVLKNWTDRVHGQPSQPFEWNYLPLLTERIVLSNKKRNLRKYSVVFFKAFSIKKGIWGSLYIHNWPLQPFSQDYGLTSHTITNLQFNVVCKQQIFEKICHGNSHKKYLFFSYFRFDAWPVTFTSNNSTQYLLDYRDFKYFRFNFNFMLNVFNLNNFFTFFSLS